jgi:hypothetical protein
LRWPTGAWNSRPSWTSITWSAWSRVRRSGSRARSPGSVRPSSGPDQGPGRVAPVH